MRIGRFIKQLVVAAVASQPLGNRTAGIDKPHPSHWSDRALPSGRLWIKMDSRTWNSDEASSLRPGSAPSMAVVVCHGL